MVTKEDVRALKGAVVLRFSYDEELGSTIHITDRNGDTRTIKTASRLDNYGYGRVVSAEHAEDMVEYNLNLKTMINCLMAGDVVTLKWVACNDNMYMEKAGLHMDELHMIIYRHREGRTDKRFSFHVASAICPDNPAKMIKLHK